MSHPEREHPQAPVLGTDFEADASLMNLLVYFNRFGTQTLYSCQGDTASNNLSAQGEIPHRTR